MPKIDQLLEIMMSRGASDLHCTSSFKPYLRVSGDMVQIEEWPVLTHEMNKAIIYEFMPEKNRLEFESRWDTDFAYELGEIGRFRVNVFMDYRGIGTVLRLIPSKIPTTDQLGLPKAVTDFCYLSKGLVLVTGPTGSGKSTTLAAMLDLINKTRTEHIITIEDPIEFLHRPLRCLINQREIHAHTKSFGNALRAALREDPDIVLVGEMRDLETIEIAIETAETGHLVFGTLHTTTAASTVDRVIDKFPTDRQNQIRTMLADTLKGVIAQTLCKKKTGGRVAAMEVLVVTTGVAANIREGKTHMIPSAMQIGKGIGMQTFGDELAKLVTTGIVTPKEAYIKAIDKEFIAKKIQDAGLELDLSALDKPEPAGSRKPTTPADRLTHYETVIRQCRDVLKKNPDSVDALNNLAWIMATNENAKLRNGREAVKCAERAFQVSQGKDPAILDTLAAAYAEVGEFPKAVAVARKAIDMANVLSRNELVSGLKKQLALYEQNQPVREA
jgi:twitching motility protein PilT